jgi:hypothetical protein
LYQNALVSQSIKAIDVENQQGPEGHGSVGPHEVASQPSSVGHSGAPPHEGCQFGPGHDDQVQDIHLQCPCHLNQDPETVHAGVTPVPMSDPEIVNPEAVLSTAFSMGQLVRNCVGCVCSVCYAWAYVCFNAIFFLRAYTLFGKQVCVYCSGPARLKCSTCHVELYCSPECQVFIYS